MAMFLIKYHGCQMGLAWAEELSVGNGRIDSEHKKLITMVNGIEYMIRAKDNFALPQALEQLEHWATLHFSEEESIARAINFPFDQHSLAHKYLLKEIRYMKDELVAKDGLWSDDASEHYSSFLSDWLSKHVTDVDMKMKPVLQNYPYDFKPD